jgi:hypothetical protein
MAASLRECFVDSRRNRSATPLRFDVGGRWFCPACAVEMTTGHRSVTCPTCHRSLNEFIYPLVEFNPHPANSAPSIDIPGWIVTYADPSLDSRTWELKEDLLQLHHPQLDRVADLGWYVDHFSVLVFQGDFHGEQLARRDTADQVAALATLRECLEIFSAK